MSLRPPMRPSVRRASVPPEAVPEGLTGVPLLRLVATYPVARYDTKAYRGVVEAANVAVKALDEEPDRLRAAYRAGMQRTATLLWDRAGRMQPPYAEVLDRALDHLFVELGRLRAPTTPGFASEDEAAVVRRLLRQRDLP